MGNETLFWVAAVVIGGQQQSIEYFLPGTRNAACYGTLTLATATGTLPFLTSPIAEYDVDNNRLFACGISFDNNKYECYTLAQAAGSKWTLFGTPVTIATKSFSSFIYNKQLWIIGDSVLKVIRLNGGFLLQNFWDTVDNPPTNPNIKTDKGTCAVVLGDYVYMFGGTNTNAVRRLYLKGLGLVSPVIDGTRKWENLGVLPFSTYSSCAPMPKNRNQIMLEVSGGTSPDAYIYDIYQMTYTPVPSSVDLAAAPLVELCHGDNTLYAFPYGTPTAQGAKSYLATGTGAGIWPDVTSTAFLTTPRYNPTAVVMVPKAFLVGAYPVDACVAC